MDEPSSNLDADSIEDLREQLRVIKAEGKSILISEHRIYYLMDLVDRIIYLDKGEIQREFTREEFLTLSEEKRIAMGLRTIHKRQSQVPKCQGSISNEQGLTFDHVSIKRNKRILQNNITFSAAKGDIIGIIGENGAGKRTWCESCIRRTGDGYRIHATGRG